MHPRSLTLVCSMMLSAGCAAAHKSSPSSPAQWDESAAYADTSSAAPGMPAAEAPLAAPQGVLASLPPPASSKATSGTRAEPTHDVLPTTGADVDQMLIFTGQMAIQVEHAGTPQAIDDVVAIAVASGGYVAEMTDTTVRIRVPSKHFRRSMHELQSLGEVRSRNVQALDVSEEFNDLKVHLDNLRATRARIEALLGQAKDLAQVLVIEKELQRVTAEIDQIEGRMRLLASQAAFSTIALAFSEHAASSELVVAQTETPPSAPRVLASSAPWVGRLGIHTLLHFRD